MKRLWFNIIIFFGCFLLLVTSLGAVLIIAPGMELLGVMYIRHTSGSVDIMKTVSDATIYDTIKIETSNIPVTIEFVQSYSLRVDLVESINGFCKASSEPSLEVSTLADTLYINSNEYEPLLASRNENSGLFIKIPMYYNNNIVVESNKSEVKFAGRNVALNDITINAKGKITFSNNIEMDSMVLNFGNKPAVVSNNVNLNGTIKATSKRGDLTIPEGFTGSVSFKSTTGDLNCASCAQLTFKSNVGKLRGIGDKLPVVAGDARIETNGKVTLGSVGGTGMIYAKTGKVTIGQENGIYTNRFEISTKSGDITLNGKYTNTNTKITTKYGDVKIGSLEYMDVTTTYGDIEIANASKGKFTTSSGDVQINTIANEVVIATKSGDVFVGGDDATVNNVSVTTKSGDVEIKNATGSQYQISTQSGDVKYTQNVNFESKLSINSKRGKVNLVDLTGETEVTTNGKITANIKKLEKPVTLKGKNKDVTVQMTQISYYDLSSNKKIIEAPGMAEQTKNFKTVPESGADNVLKIETKRGKISVIYNK